MTGKHGIVVHNNNTIQLTQEAYLDTYQDTTAYFARGNDGQHTYRIRWNNLAAGHVNDSMGYCVICGKACDYEDESICADWGKPAEVEQLD